MVLITERVQADFMCEKIKESIKCTNLNYVWQESPYNLSIKIKKSAIRDFSPTAKTTNSPIDASSPTRIPNSPFETFDSGFENEKDAKIEDARKELVETIVESNEKINSLENDLEQKNSKISKLISEVDSLTDKCNNIKKEVSTRSEQLKQKNKAISDLNSKLQKALDDNLNLKLNYENKIQNLDNKNKNLLKNTEISSKTLKEVQGNLKESEKESDILKADLKKLKAKLLSGKRETKEKSTQSHIFNVPDQNMSTQTFLSVQPNMLQSTVSTQTTLQSQTIPTKSTTPTKTSTLTLIKCRLLLTILFPFPSEWDQMKWPDKSILDEYKLVFGEHNCEDCIHERVPFKLNYNVNGIPGSFTKYRSEYLPICRNNLVIFDKKKWWISQEDKT